MEPNFCILNRVIISDDIMAMLYREIIIFIYENIYRLDLFHFKNSNFISFY